MSMVTCLICNSQYKRITASHLRGHGYTTHEYLCEFPEELLFSDELRHAYGKSARDNNPMKNPETANKVRVKLTGVSKSDEHKENLSKAKVGKSWGKHSDEHKEYMREVSRKNMLNRIDTGWKPPEWTEERREKQRETMIGNTHGKNSHHNKGRNLQLSDAQRGNRSEKRRRYMAENNGIIRTSSLESKYAAWCSDNNIEYISQFPIYTDNGAWIYDFLLPGLGILVELDGEYWHCTKKQLNRDRIKNRIAEDNGYTLLRISNSNLDFRMTFSTTEEIKAHSESIILERHNKLGGSSKP